jgi:hypothetical protein
MKENGKISSVSDWAAKNRGVNGTNCQPKQYPANYLQCIQPIKTRISYNILMYELLDDNEEGRN